MTFHFNGKQNNINIVTSVCYRYNNEKLNPSEAKKHMHIHVVINYKLPRDLRLSVEYWFRENESLFVYACVHDLIFKWLEYELTRRQGNPAKRLK